MFVGTKASRFVRIVFEDSSHQVPSRVLHLLHVVLSSRISGRGCPHSAQYMFGAYCGCEKRIAGSCGVKCERCNTK